MPTMMEGEGENGPSNCSWEVYLGAEAFCWYRYALLFRPSTPHTKGEGRVERAAPFATRGATATGGTTTSRSSSLSSCLFQPLRAGAGGRSVPSARRSYT